MQNIFRPFPSLTAKYDSLSKAARAIKSPALRDAVEKVLGCGYVNANDTIYAEKAAPESDWPRLFIDTVQFHLDCEEHSAAVRRWFASQL